MNIFKIGDIVKIADDFPFRHKINLKELKKLHRTIINIDDHSIFLDKPIGNYNRYHCYYFKIDIIQTRKAKLKKLSK